MIYAAGWIPSNDSETQARYVLKYILNDPESFYKDRLRKKRKRGKREEFYQQHASTLWETAFGVNC